MTFLLMCLAPIVSIAAAVPQYGHLPPSSLSIPTVTSTPANVYGNTTNSVHVVSQQVVTTLIPWQQGQEQCNIVWSK